MGIEGEVNSQTLLDALNNHLKINDRIIKIDINEFISPSQSYQVSIQAIVESKHFNKSLKLFLEK